MENKAIKTKVLKDKKKDITLGKNHTEKEFLEMMHQLFNQLSTDAQFSKELLDMDIKDSFSEIVSDTLKNPLKSSFDAYTSIEKALTELINQYVIEYLGKHKKQVLEVYRQKNRGNVLYYLVWLKDNELSTKRILLDFYDLYEKTPYDSRFPVILEDVPHEIKKEFRKELATNTYDRVL